MIFAADDYDFQSYIEAVPVFNYGGLTVSSGGGGTGDNMNKQFLGEIQQLGLGMNFDSEMGVT